MTPSILQGVLMPLSFGSLFSLMLLYWGQAALFSYTKYSKLTTVLLSFSFVSLTALLLLRWIDSGHFPLSNLYESLLFLSWSFLGIQLVAQQAIPLLEVFLIVPIPIVAEPARRVFISPQQQLLHLLGVIISPMALLTYGFAFLNLPREMQKATALVPALQSNWLMMHVTIMILSYAALLCGSIFSMVFLLLTSLNPSPPKSSVQTASKPDHAHYTQVTEAAPSLAKRSLNTFVQSAPALSRPDFASQSKERTSFENQVSRMGSLLELTFASRGKLLEKQDQEQEKETPYLSLAERLDNYSYRVLALGFPLLTIGILSGAVWANEAWGSYWSWDPKESWALITWLVFAIYLHARILKGWTGRKPAIIATFGFFVVWFCYLGVNLLGTGLHSYGWFST